MKGHLRVTPFHQVQPYFLNPNVHCIRVEAVQLHLHNYDGHVREPDIGPSGEVGRGGRVKGDGDSRVVVLDGLAQC